MIRKAWPPGSSVPVSPGQVPVSPDACIYQGVYLCRVFCLFVEYPKPPRGPTSQRSYPGLISAATRDVLIVQVGGGWAGPRDWVDGLDPGTGLPLLFFSFPVFKAFCATVAHIAVSEDRTRDLRIMRPTRCQLRYHRSESRAAGVCQVLTLLPNSTKVTLKSAAGVFAGNCQTKISLQTPTTCYRHLPL